MTTASIESSDELPELWQMTPRARGIALGFYQLGYEHGINHEHDRMERFYHEELRELGTCFCLSDAEVRAVYLRVANSPTHAELLERRGRPGEAARFRGLLAARGLGVPAA